MVLSASPEGVLARSSTQYTALAAPLSGSTDDLLT
jgi:hypothetical protein